MSSAVLAVLAAGCSGVPAVNYDDLGLVNVTGTILLDGVALADAVVTFEDVTTGQFSYAQTDSAGFYDLQLDSEVKGIMPGEKLVQISTTRKILGLNSEDESPAGEGSQEGDEAKPSVEMVPSRYNKKSELRVTVTESETTFDFDLQSR